MPNSSADQNQPQFLNARGLSALEAGQANEAIQHFTAATRADPTAPPLWMNLAKAHRLAGDDGAERTTLEQVLSLDQLHLMALIRLAELHERLGELGAAEDRWVMVLGICAQIPDRTAQLDALLDHARRFVAARKQALAEAVEATLEADLGAASERDRRRAAAAIDLMLGRRQVFTNACHGYRYPFLPADEFFDRGHFPWLEKLEAATAVIREELESILGSRDPGLAPYIEMPPGTPHNLWSELDGSADWSALHLWRDGERIDAVCKRAPRTAELVETLPLARIPGRAPAVFFSILKAGKRIPPTPASPTSARSFTCP